MARSIWKGTLGFGLVSIGAELFPAEAPERLDLHLLDKRDLSRIGYLKINKSTGKPLDESDIVHGFEVSSNRFVVLTDEDRREANPKATRMIDVIGFLGNEAIPRIYFAKPYFIGPTKGSERAYALLRDTLEHTSRMALAQVVIRTRQYMTAVYPFKGILVAHMLRYDEEIYQPADLDIAAPRGKGAARASELAMAKQLVEGMAVDWTPKEYRDEYRDDLLALVKKRAKGARRGPGTREEEGKGKEPRVLDLMEALRRSVSEHRGARGRKAGTHHKRRSA